MLTYTYISKGKFALMEKPKPVLRHERDAIVKVTLASICSSDLHIKHGSVPRAVPGITVGHEMVGIVEEVGSAVTNVKPGDRVTVNVETFCGECFFCKKGFVNNCTDQNGGWALGCRIDGGQAEYVHALVKDSAVTGVPSVNFQPSLSLMVYWVASSLDLMDSATSLEALPLASKEIRRANSRSSGLPPPVSLQSPGMSGFCGSELYAVMTLEPLSAVESPLEEPQPLSSMPNAHAAAAKARAFFFMEFIFSLSIISRAVRPCSKRRRASIPWHQRPSSF